jgi:release factor glutamine methyltransferase
VLDLCCGSGCICIYIKKHFPKSQVFAVDISEEALNVARKNAEKNNVEIIFKKCDIFSDEILKFKDIDTIISNPPYVCESEKKYIKKNVLNYEPAIALFVKDDNPLIFYKRICEIIPTILKKGGSVYCEINEKYGNKTVEIFKNLHFKKKYIKKDINKKNRFIYLLNYE